MQHCKREYCNAGTRQWSQRGIYIRKASKAKNSEQIIIRSNDSRYRGYPKTEKNAIQQRGVVTIQEAVTGFLAEKENTIKLSSYLRYEQMLRKHILPSLGRVCVDQLSTNVLDALLVAFWLNGTDITDSNKVVAGWDANPLEGNPGGYINGVYPQYATYGNPYPDTETINGVVYNKYSGSGWNIAYGSNASNIAATGTYSTNVTLTDGMIIVFDFSPYCIYEVQSNS